MFKFLAELFGAILLLPIALVVVALVICTLIGGYIGLILQYSWELILIVALVIIAIKILKRVLK